MTELSDSLCRFKKKIEEAVILVPEMIAEEKLKAVQFWNVVSERLQEIVNNSAADINALAQRLEQEESQQNHQTIEQSLGQQTQSQTQSPQPSVPLMDTISTNDGSDNDKREPILSDPKNKQNLSHDNTNITNINNEITRQEFGQTMANTDSESVGNKMDEHLASVITSYHETHDSNPNQIQDSQHLVIGFGSEKQSKESQEVLQHLIRNRLEGNTSSATTSVIQELDQNLLTTQRRNVIQSTQRAIEAIEKNLQNCCNDFENKNHLNINNSINNHMNSDNTCDESIISCNINTNNNQLIKVNETTDESLGESSTNNHIFTETSFDVSSYGSSEDMEQKEFTIEEDLNENNSTKMPNNNSIKKKSKLNKKTKSSDNTKEENGNKSQFECDICHKVLPNNSALVTHKWIHSKPYSCPECEARFSTRGNLVVHQRRHSGEKPFACPQCTASFSTKGNLKRHIKAHSGERPWKCTQCDSRFTEKKSLKVHMRRHTGEKPYQCSVCGKSFSQTGVLQTHMALHLDERKHLCELCGKAFRQRSQLRLHVLRHEGVKRWDCSDCEAKFLTKGDLERHHRVHTGERPFVCDLCGKTFTRQQSLNEHSNRHYGLKPYSCTVCSKTFAEMSACYKHIKVHKKQQSLNNKMNESTDKTITKSQTNHTITKRQMNTNEIKSRSQINVIQSTTTSSTGADNNLIYMQRSEQMNSNTNVSIDSFISSNSNNNTNDNNSIEYVDFAAINLLANTSTQQQNY